MEEHRKNAYRYLLYWAMLHIRPIGYIKYHWHRLLNPWFLRRWLRDVVTAGTVAEWLHNLALFASLDFDRFDEARFWAEFEDLRRTRPLLVDFQSIFERRLHELQFPPPEDTD